MSTQAATALPSTAIRYSPDLSPQWQAATWEDYLACCQRAESEQAESFKIFFNQGYLFIDMGWEGIDHARFRELLTMIITFWFAAQPDAPVFDCLGGCIIEKPDQKAGAPDQVLYIGGDSPRWQTGEPRRINLRQWRVPNLVCEVSDTTLATDLDEKKQLYAALEIPEYWVIDVDGYRVLAFRLGNDGRYRQCAVSGALDGLAIALVEQAFARLSQGTNGSAALWFAQQLQK
jgi:Uma2 family endonuclease